MGGRAFSHPVPRHWNSLPLHIHQLDSVTQFKTAVKMHLLKLVYLQSLLCLCDCQDMFYV
ncbi:hypothetical protein LDENG_00153670 [Lucifuga dentata]|nr:hypothetical protein LDENG_00153670 [Lucifuga dentata]